MTGNGIPLSYTILPPLAPSAVDPRFARMTAMDIPLCRYRQHKLNGAVGPEILNQVQDDGEGHSCMQQEMLKQVQHDKGGDILRCYGHPTAL
jgi:hypothetical protein